MRHRTMTLPLRAATAGTALLLSLPLCFVGGAAAHAARPDADAAAASREAPGPIHAGNTFGWYSHGGLVYDETFVGPLNRTRWHVTGPGVVRNQHGMLTLNTATHGSVSARMTIPGRATGRWETRLRQHQYGHGHTPYRVLTELVPVAAAGERCGEESVALNAFTMGGHKVDFSIRTHPDNLYRASTRRDVGQDQWHTYAVEVTTKRISWFVDSHVIRSETRPDALSGRRFQVRFTMQARPGKPMNPARMQMDWLRYWNLKAKSKHSTRAPLTKHTTETTSCPTE